MIHIINNIWMDIDEYNVIICEKSIVPDINEKTQKPNKSAGEVVFNNQKFYPTVNRALTALVENGIDERLINGDIKQAMDFGNKVMQRIGELVKDKRYDIRANI